MWPRNGLPALLDTCLSLPNEKVAVSALNSWEGAFGRGQVAAAQAEHVVERIQAVVELESDLRASP